jgi:hypothetical protein
VIEGEQRRGQMRLVSLPGADGGTIRAELCNIRIALAQRLQDWNEEERLAENPWRRKPQRIPEAPMVMLVCQHRAEFRLYEQLDGAPGDVDSRTQVTGAEGLGHGSAITLTLGSQSSGSVGPISARNVRYRRDCLQPARMVTAIAVAPSAPTAISSRAGECQRIDSPKTQRR